MTTMIRATLSPAGESTEDTTAQVSIGDTQTVDTHRNLDDARGAVLDTARGAAQQAGTVIQLHTIEPGRQWLLAVHPDGKVTEWAAANGHTPVAHQGTPAQQSPTTPTPATAPARAMRPQPPAVPASPAPAHAAHEALASAHPPAPPAEPAPAGRRSFLAHDQTEEPAAKGWRSVLRLGPSARERAERADAALVSQHWPGPRTIAVVNGKGGAGKTPITILLSAVFARLGGAGVLAWDHNQTRGTLPWRTEQGTHEATVHDLLPHTDQLLGTSAQSADLARFVHHQRRDQYDVLRSQPMVLAAQQRLGIEAVDQIHQVASKYYRLIFMDSGNDESDPMWLRMIDLADQIVVATTGRDEHAEAGALLLEALTDRDDHSAQLARGAVVIVSQADAHAKPGAAQNVANGFRDLARAVAVVPYDPAMVTGALTYGRLAPATQRAWLAAAAAVAQGL